MIVRPWLEVYVCALSNYAMHILCLLSTVKDMSYHYRITNINNSRLNRSHVDCVCFEYYNYITI